MKTFLIDDDSNFKVKLDGCYKIKEMKRKINDGGDGTVFLAKDSYNVNMFHHGTEARNHILTPELQSCVTKSTQI